MTLPFGLQIPPWPWMSVREFWLFLSFTLAIVIAAELAFKRS
jgi:hypothetical protein